MKVLELAEQLRQNSLRDMDLDFPEPTQEQNGHVITNLASELDRARIRIQGNTLRSLGAMNNGLWHAALKMLCLGRVICQSKVEESPTIQADENRHPTPIGSASHGRWDKINSRILKLRGCMLCISTGSESTQLRQS